MLEDVLKISGYWTERHARIVLIFAGYQWFLLVYLVKFATECSL